MKEEGRKKERKECKKGERMRGRTKERTTGMEKGRKHLRHDLDDDLKKNCFHLNYNSYHVLLIC